jgi:predicted DNA-binding transcriptional regulator AlpA
MRAVSTRTHYVIQSNDAAYLTASQIRERFGVSDMWLWRAMRDRNFPQPVRFGPKTSRRFWRVVDVEAWERERIALAQVRP